MRSRNEILKYNEKWGIDQGLDRLKNEILVDIRDLLSCIDDNLIRIADALENKNDKNKINNSIYNP